MACKDNGGGGMTPLGAETPRPLVALAPAPVAGPSGLDAERGNFHTPMPYTCQTCTRRKVKCDRRAPVCTSCRKSKLPCSYQAPGPRARRAKLTQDVLERLARYERILREHGLLQENDVPPAEEQPVSLLWTGSTPARRGKLVADQDKSIYVDSSIWENLGDDAMYSTSKDDHDQAITKLSASMSTDPLTGTLMGMQQDLLSHHPTEAHAIMLWETHVECVEPLCKILHVPSLTTMVQAVSKRPETASRADEALLFAIYHFAVFSMSCEACEAHLGESRDTLLDRYHFATRQALVNAGFLRTTDMRVLQALVLFLMPGRYFYDADTYWILTGVAVRIAQRMGIHRDGDKLGLPPFDVEMRRRLFYQLVPLDGNASQTTGTVVSLMSPDAWDSKPPLNVNDEQIWPGMTQAPEEHRGATEMMFCLSRIFLGGKMAKSGESSGEFKTQQDADKFIDAAEKEVEDKFIRYCDIVDPLHLLTMGLARSGITALRLRARLPKARQRTATVAELREMAQLAQKIIDTDAIVHSHVGLGKYEWHVRGFFLWGAWESIIFLLTTLAERHDLLSQTETAAVWRALEQLFENHADLSESERRLDVALRRLTLKAWGARRPSPQPELGFISGLRARVKVKAAEKKDCASDDALAPGQSGTGLSGVLDDIEPDPRSDFDFDIADWLFWDELIQQHQVEAG